MAEIFSRQKVDLPEMTEGDHLHWPAMIATQGGADPGLSATKIRIQFRRKDGTLGCTLSTDSGESGALDLTLSDAASWAVAEAKFAASAHGLTAGYWHWDLEVTQSDDSVRTVAFGVLKVLPQQTRPA